MILKPWDMKKKNAQIVDLSHYDIMPDFAELKRGGVDGVIFKDDEMTAVHVLWARAAGLLVVGLYGWVDPNQNGKQQALEFVDHLKLYQVPSGWADCEQEYKYWNEYVAYLQGKLSWAKVTKVPAADTRRVFMDYMDTLNVEGAKLGIKTGMYSRRELLLRIFTNKDLSLNGAARNLAGVKITDAEWLELQIQWMAQYIFYPKSIYTARNWPDVWSKIPALLFAAYNGFLVVLTDPEGWQWTGDRLIIPGLKSAADISIFRGTIEELCAWLGIKEIPAAAPVPFLMGHLKPEKATALNKRPGPADFSKVVGILHAGEAIYLTADVRQVVDGSTWAKLWNESAWINLAYVNIG